ncbi:type VI secretion system baseplate subunit TssG [Rugamonas sp. CCM 8940]|uniref:type VI secretion system baseplate subunit TssG n=1 Tax=Rugamonas sp. CCM 8940 TaxID=2765359 RepID=UPI0018F2CCB1|nr:type VI secretion system baseplate subunit TssG [Rugamonas sp. CCM 8940]MBJ7312821.1 type VI secretion system baseplate subunit TssG [Rugamonas sp. CCM 8940]
MPAPQRCFESSVIEQLLRHPYRFEFFQAVRLLDTWLRQNGVEEGPIPLRHLRFLNNLSLSFPASQIAALTAESASPIDSAAGLQQAMLSNELKYIAITPAFIGFLGCNGGLPFHETERIAAYEQASKDAGPRAFLDMFSTRSVALFYQAWSKHRPECMVDAAGEDAFLAMLSALSGLPTRAKTEFAAADGPADIGDEMLAFYAAQFSSRCVPASVIAGVLSEHFAVAVALEQLLGCWETLPDQHRAKLGIANCKLGAGSVLGRNIYRRDCRCRVRLGPLDKNDFERFLPRSAGARALNDVLAKFCGVGMTFEVQLLLRAQDVRRARLRSREGKGHSRLGIDAFMFGGTARQDRLAVRYFLRP